MLEIQRVVVTRSPDQAPALAERLAARGAHPLLFPVLDFAALPAPEFDAVLAQLHCYAWLIFTSANAVQFFLRRASAIDLAHLPRVAAIGSATAASLREAGLEPDFVPAEFTGEQLAAGLGNLTGKRVLLPRAKIGRPEIIQALATQGAEVDDIALYDTITASPEPVAFAELAQGFEAVIFTSPSSVRNFLSLIAPHHTICDHLAQAVVACIGPATAGAAEAAGLSVAVSPTAYTVEAVVEALMIFLRPDGRPSHLSGT